MSQLRTLENTPLRVIKALAAHALDRKVQRGADSKPRQCRGQSWGVFHAHRHWWHMERGTERQRNDEKRLHAMSGRHDPGVLSPEGWDRGSNTRQLEEGSNHRKHLQEGSRAMDGT